jgi:protein-disulfide isomerase
MNRIGYVCALIVTLTACQKDESRLDEMAARLEKLEKRVDTVEKRPAAAARPERKRPDPSVVYNLPVDDSDVVKGPKHAKVTVVTGSEFACPWCALSHPAVEELAKKYPDAVRVVAKQYIVHPDTATLPAYGLCAAQKQGKGAAYERALWSRAWKIEDGRPRLDGTGLKQEALDAVAGEVSLDVAKWKADLASSECKQWLARQQGEFSRIGVSSTPSFFINGRPYSGPRTLDGFSMVVEEEIKKADEAIAKGVKAEEYYATLMKTAQKSL